MCAKIAAACAKTGATMPDYPKGATIDARGFTGDRLCAAANITTMLNSCVTGTGGHNGGKLVLGNVHLYADGPAGGTSGNYTDGKVPPSGVGTPALIIPSGFWGIEGISRGAGDSGSKLGTFLTVCTPTTPPAIGCTNRFPIRSFTVTSTTVPPPVNGVTTMTMTVSPAANFGVNIYPGELAMMKGNTSAPAENGTYKVQNNSPDTTIKVTVPSGTPPCASLPCGTLFLGTPIVGFGGAGTYNQPSTCSNPLCSGFGQHIKNVGFNCQAQDGCIGWQNLYAEEGAGVDTFTSTQNNFVAVDVHNPSLGTQNFGPILNAEIYTGAGNAACDYGTTGIYIGDAQMRGLNGWTIVQSNENPNPPGQVCLNNPIAAVLFDAPNTEIVNGHCEGFNNCVLMGANNAPNTTLGTLGASGEKVSAVAGANCHATTCNVVHISKNYPNNSDYVIQNIRKKSGFTNTIADDVNGVTISNDLFTGLYSWGSNVNNAPPTVLTNLVTTDTSIRNRFDAGVQAKNLISGVSTPTDISGRVTLSGGSATQSLTGSYMSPPNCGCWDVTTSATACTVTEGTAMLTFHAGTGTDTVKYICIGRN